MARRTPSQRKRRGAAAIEFALLLPVFIAILFGIIEWSWFFFQQGNVIASVRDALRYAVTLPQTASPAPDQEAETRCATNLRGVGFSTSQVTDANITAVYTGSTPEETLTLRAEVPYRPIIGMNVFFPASISTVSAEMTMLLELQD